MLQSTFGRDDPSGLLPIVFLLSRIQMHFHVTAPARCELARCVSSYKEAPVAKKLYVGNLTYGTTDTDLQTLFGPFGTVQSAQVIMDRETGRSKGFGFVEMNTSEEAQAAIKGLHDKELDGRKLTVNEAKPREERVGGGSRGGSGKRY
jgi:cold-inducible RNA-binding protein